MKPFQPEFITIGKILATSGVKGKLKVDIMTDFPQRFAPSSQVYVKHQPMTIDSCIWRKGKAIIKLSVINSLEEAQKLKGQPIEIEHSQLMPLPAGEYYHFQIVGLEAWTTQGEQLGNITEILPAESNDIYVVNGNRGEILIPAIEDIVKSVDLDQGRMVIEPIEGLLSLNKKPLS